MGNSNQVSTVVSIHTEKDYYLSGDIVQGIVFMKVKVSERKRSSIILKNHVKNLHLVLIGGELSNVTYSNPGANATNESFDRVEHVFLQKHFLLDKLDLQLHEGEYEYEYPFSFRLPVGLPSSFEINRNSGSFCKIEYVLRPVIVLQNEKGKEEDIMLYEHENIKYKNKKRLNIKAVHEIMTSEPTTPVIPEPTRFSTNICCCFNKGQVILAGSTARNKYTVGDKLEVAYSIDDQTTKQNLSRLSVILVQNISWHGHYKQHSTHKIMACGGKIDLDLDYCDNDVSHNKKMNEFTHKINNYVNFHIREPNSNSSGGMILQPYVGKYIEVSHYVEVRVKAGFWLSDIVLKIPVFIVPLKEASDKSSMLNKNDIFQRSAKIEYLRSSSNETSEKTFVESDSFSTDDDNTDYTFSITFQTIVDKLSDTSNGLLTLQSMLQNNDHEEETNNNNNRVFDEMLPQEYATLLNKISFDPDRVEAAKMIAKIMETNSSPSSNTRFTCEHIKAALCTVSMFDKPHLVRTLAPYAHDFQDRKESIKEKLDFFEIEKCKDLF